MSRNARKGVSGRWPTHSEDDRLEREISVPMASHKDDIVLCEACLMDEHNACRTIQPSVEIVAVPEDVDEDGLLYVCESHYRMIDEWKLVVACAYAGIKLPEEEYGG